MVNQNDDFPKFTQHKTIVYSVVGLSLAAVLGYVLMAFFGKPPPESLVNLAIGGMGILGGLAVPQQK